MSQPSPDDRKRPAGDGEGAHDEVQRSGEGAQTALRALIRQRKLAENPQGSEPDPPGPPTQS